MHSSFSDFWLTKEYKAEGVRFTFFWAISAQSWDDAIRHFTLTAGMKDFVDKRPVVVSWQEPHTNGYKHCRVTKEKPECLTGNNFSLRDERMKKPLPKQLSFL